MLGIQDLEVSIEGEDVHVRCLNSSQHRKMYPQGAVMTKCAEYHVQLSQTAGTQHCLSTVLALCCLEQSNSVKAGKRQRLSKSWIFGMPVCPIENVWKMPES